MGDFLGAWWPALFILVILLVIVGWARREIMRAPLVESTTGPLPGNPERCPQLWGMVAAIEAGEYDLPQFAEEEDRP